MPLVPWCWEGRRAHSDSKDETFCSALKAASDFIKKCTFSALRTRGHSPCLLWEDWLRRQSRLFIHLFNKYLANVSRSQNGPRLCGGSHRQNRPNPCPCGLYMPPGERNNKRMPQCRVRAMKEMEQGTGLAMVWGEGPFQTGWRLL